MHGRSAVRQTAGGLEKGAVCFAKDTNLLVNDKTNRTAIQLEETKDLITTHTGLALLGEFAVGLGLLNALDKDLPAPGSGASYRASEHVFALILMLNGGGRSLEDLRQIRDDGLRQVLPLHRLPSSDATGDWLRRSGAPPYVEPIADFGFNFLH